MKKLILTLVFISCLFGATLAQTQQGSLLIGGTATAHFDTEGEEREKGYFLILSPRAGVFIADNFAVGAALPGTFSGADDYTALSVGITPFLRGYVGDGTTRFLLEGRLGYSYANLKVKGDMGDFSHSDTYLSYGAGVGFANFINEYVALEFLVSYDKMDADATIIDYTNFTGINLNIGLQIHLPSGK